MDKDFDHLPTTEEIRSGLGTSYLLWIRLTRSIEIRYQITGEWSSWGPAEVGWGLRYRRNNKTLVTLYPQKDKLTALVVLGKQQAEQALLLELSELTDKIIRGSPQLRDGRWLMIPVTSKEAASDIEKLVRIKMKPIHDPG